MSDKLSLQLKKFEQEYEGLKKEFARDGNISRDELVILKSVQTKLDGLRKKIVERNEKEGILDFADEPIEVKSTVKSYDDAVFTTAFNQSLRDWSQDGNIALNRVKTYFIKADGPSELGINELLDVVGLALLANPTATAVLGVVKTSVTLIQAAYKASLPATPSLNEIHSAWAVALNKYGGGDHSKEFQLFVETWKKQNKIESDVAEVPLNLFLPACAGYAAKYMPTAAQVEKAFLSKILEKSKSEDSWDSDLEGGLDDAGVAEIDLIYLARNFSFDWGQLDDVSEQLLEAVRTVWSKNKVIDLPVQVYFKVSSVMGVEHAEIQRTSRTPGDTNFKLRSGERDVFDDFMKQEAYLIPKVSQLKVDGV